MDRIIPMQSLSLRADDAQGAAGSVARLLWTIFAVGLFAAQLTATQAGNAQSLATANAPKNTSVLKKPPTRKHPGAAHSNLVLTPVPPAPVAQLTTPEVPKPELPNWPANHKPAPATVTWDSQGLRIEAENSSLREILSDVATATGASIEGVVDDQRVFGNFGPGKAGDVLSQLLQGSGYNILMVGDQGMGAPRQILLTTLDGSKAQPAATTPHPSDEDAENDDQPQPTPPVVQPPQPYRPGFGPGRSPQQMMQEQMQMRQQQRQQQLQQGNPPQN